MWLMGVNISINYTGVWLFPLVVTFGSREYVISIYMTECFAFLQEFSMSLGGLTKLRNPLKADLKALS